MHIPRRFARVDSVPLGLDGLRAERHFADDTLTLRFVMLITNAEDTCCFRRCGGATKVSAHLKEM